MPVPGRSLSPAWMLLAFLPLIFSGLLAAKDVSLQAIVTPSTVVLKDGRPVTFAIHGFIEFKSLAELFPYIDSQTGRWPDRADFGKAQREALAHELLRRGVESR